MKHYAPVRMLHCAVCAVEWAAETGPDCWSCGVQGLTGLINAGYRHGSATWHPGLEDEERAA